jgi:hypothetical protein
VNDVWSHVPHQVMHIKCQHITLERSLKQESPRNTPPIEICSIVGPDAGDMFSLAQDLPIGGVR